MRGLFLLACIAAAVGVSSVSLHHTKSASSLQHVIGQTIDEHVFSTVMTDSGWKKSTVTDLAPSGCGTMDWTGYDRPASDTFTETPVQASYGPYGLLDGNSKGFYGDADVTYFKKDVYFTGAVSGKMQVAVDNNVKVWINGSPVARSEEMSGSQWTAPFLEASFDTNGVTAVLNDFIAEDASVQLNADATPNEFIFAMRNCEGQDIGALEAKVTLYGSVSDIPPTDAPTTSAPTSSPPTSSPTSSPVSSPPSPPATPSEAPTVTPLPPTDAPTTSAPTSSPPTSSPTSSPVSSPPSPPATPSEAPTVTPAVPDAGLVAPKVEPAPDAPIMHTGDWIHAIVLGPDEVPPKLPGTEEEDDEAYDDDYYGSDGSGYGSGSDGSGYGSDAGSAAEGSGSDENTMEELVDGILDQLVSNA